MTNKGRHNILGQVGPAGVLVAYLLISACSFLPKGEMSLDLGIKDRGVASWYGEAFHGKQAANGEIFDKNAYTAAHRKLPLGSIVRVMNLDNGKIVQVRITDRGPYVVGRMLDLSEAAAQELGMVEAGIAAVQVEVIGDHRMLPPLPHNLLSFAFSVRPVSEATDHPSSPDALKRLAVLGRRQPQDVLYVRRERRLRGPLAVHDPAQLPVPLFLMA